MKFSIKKHDLLIGLQRLQNVVERKTAMPILSNALITANKRGVSLLATDLEVCIQSMLSAEILEVGSITVKARSLLDIVRELPETTIRFVDNDNYRLEITANKSVFNVNGISAEHFPDIPILDEEDKTFVRMNGEYVNDMLEKTLYAASLDESRYYLNGIFFEPLEEPNKKRSLRFVATDAHRLSYVDCEDALFDDKAWKLFQEGVIVPRKGLTELKRLLLEGNDDFFVTIKDRLLFIKREQTWISMKLIEGKYADYRRIIPECSMNPIPVQKELFLASLKRISLMSNDKSRSVTMSLSNGMMQLSSQSPELGEAKEEINIDYTGEEFKISFNSKYLIDALATMDGEIVHLEVRDKQSPGTLKSTEGINHRCVIMPMRV